MIRIRTTSGVAAPLALALALTALPLAAQTIVTKTVPIATGDQFLIVPGRLIGMGAVGLTLRDEVADPFANPAKGSRISGARLFVAPSHYSISDDLGAGTTLGMGGVLRATRWFGGVAVALQQLEDPVRTLILPAASTTTRLVREAPTNSYVQGLIGRVLGDGRTAIGAGIFHAHLNAVEGVNQLYASAGHLEQDGGMTDVRAGMLREFEDGGWLEATLLHRRLDMRHDVTTVRWVQAGPVPWEWQPLLSEERNLDRTWTTGLHVGWVRPLDWEEPGWSLGLGFTANRKMHPKIPNYEIVNVPRDPGNSTAFGLAAGLARVDGPRTFAIEAAFEPARSHTWADTPEPLPTVSGRTIPARGKTIENWFRFSNTRLAAGFERDNPGFAWQLGITTTHYRYRLIQTDYIAEFTRRTNEGWFEWTPAWGAVLKAPGLDVRYAGRLTVKGSPFNQQARGTVAMPDAPGVDFLAAPTAPVSLPDFAAWTHQISVVVPVGRRSAGTAR